MRDTRAALVVVGLGGLAWWLYTRQQGLTLTGTYANPMLAPAPRPNQQSLVTPSDSTSTWATNATSAIAGAFERLLRSLQSNPGNAPRVPSASSTISPANVGSWGQQVPPTAPAAPIGGSLLLPDNSLDSEYPFWSWGYPIMTGVPSMPWTLDPKTLGYDPWYIPPPPLPATVAGSSASSIYAAGGLTVGR